MWKIAIFGWLHLLRLTPPPTEGFAWDDLRKIFRGCQWMVKVPNGVEILPKISTGWVWCTNVTDRQTTDGRATAYIAKVNLESCYWFNFWEVHYVEHVTFVADVTASQSQLRTCDIWNSLLSCSFVRSLRAGVQPTHLAQWHAIDRALARHIPNFTITFSRKRNISSWDLELWPMTLTYARVNSRWTTMPSVCFSGLSWPSRQLLSAR